MRGPEPVQSSRKLFHAIEEAERCTRLWAARGVAVRRENSLLDWRLPLRGSAIGSTPDFGSGYPGSSPGPGANLSTELPPGSALHHPQLSRRLNPGQLFACLFGAFALAGASSRRMGFPSLTSCHPSARATADEYRTGPQPASQFGPQYRRLSSGDYRRPGPAGEYTTPRART